MAKSIHNPSTETTAPPRVPLGPHDPTAYEVARHAMDDGETLRTMLEAIKEIATFKSGSAYHVVAHKLVLARDLAKTGKYLADDALNSRSLMLAACMLASEDPAIRKAARP